MDVTTVVYVYLLVRTYSVISPYHVTQVSRSPLPAPAQWPTVHLRHQVLSVPPARTEPARHHSQAGAPATDRDHLCGSLVHAHVRDCIGMSRRYQICKRVHLSRCSVSMQRAYERTTSLLPICFVSCNSACTNYMVRGLWVSHRIVVCGTARWRQAYSEHVTNGRSSAGNWFG